MKYMMFVVVDPALQAEPSPDDLTIDQWLAEVDGRAGAFEAGPHGFGGDRHGSVEAPGSGRLAAEESVQHALANLGDRGGVAIGVADHRFGREEEKNGDTKVRWIGSPVRTSLTARCQVRRCPRDMG